MAKSAGSENHAGWGTVAVLSIMVLAVVCLIAVPAVLLTVHMPRNYNEGWNAFFADRAIAGGALYLEPGSTIFNNYPPLSFYLVGGIGRLLGDSIIAGRVVSWLSLAWISFSVASIIRARGSETPFAVFGALLFLFLMAAAATQYIGSNDPQLLGHALQAQGLALMLRAESPASRDRIFASLLFVMAGVLVKHNLLAIPLAITAGLFLKDRRGFNLWIAAGLALSALVMCMLLAVYGVTVFRAILLHPRVVSWDRSLVVAKAWIKPQAPFAVFAALAFFQRRRTLAGLVLGVYLIASVVLALIFGAGEGVSINCVFDLIIAVATGTALFGANLEGWLGRRSITQPCALAMIFLLAPALLHLRPAIAGQKLLLQMMSYREQFSREIDAIARQPGPVACEALSLCYWAGKNFEIDFFNTGQAIRKGALDEGVVLRLIDEGSLAAIQVGDPSHVDGALASVLLPTAVNQMIASRYQPLGDYPLTLYGRKR